MGSTNETNPSRSQTLSWLAQKGREEMTVAQTSTRDRTTDCNTKRHCIHRPHWPHGDSDAAECN